LSAAFSLKKIPTHFPVNAHRRKTRFTGSELLRICWRVASRSLQHKPTTVLALHEEIRNMKDTEADKAAWNTLSGPRTWDYWQQR